MLEWNVHRTKQIWTSLSRYLRHPISPPSALSLLVKLYANVPSTTSSTPEGSTFPVPMAIGSMREDARYHVSSHKCFCTKLADFCTENDGGSCAIPVVRVLTVQDQQTLHAHIRLCRLLWLSEKDRRNGPPQRPCHWCIFFWNRLRTGETNSRKRAILMSLF